MYVILRETLQQKRCGSSPQTPMRISVRSLKFIKFIILVAFLYSLPVLPEMYQYLNESVTYKSAVYTSPELQNAPVAIVQKKVVQSTKLDIKELISRHFKGEDAKVAYAIIKAESSGNARATGFNCYYTKDGVVHETRVQGAFSTFCKKGHEQYANSTDCGLAQISFKGKVCPQKAYDPEWNIAEMKKYHDTRGWSPWVAYNTKKHLAYMK